jgi:hypothetical protein
MQFRLPWLLLFPLLGTDPASAAVEQVWLIGGGPDVLNSQVQIERNLLWTLETLQRLPGKRQIRVYFTDGDDPAPDVAEWSPIAGADNLEPLARVFNSQWMNGEQYRAHRIPGVEGPTTATSLVEDLGAQLRAMPPSGAGWLIFNGHGGREEDGSHRIELWNDTWLGVQDLTALLDQAPPEMRLRFLLTQCYAGGFAPLAVEGTNRCGFMAEAADQEAEGCSAAIEESGYEDYSTFFFAALGGRTRDGGALADSADLDRDGQVSPLEAHLYTLTHAYNSDIPLATSEVLLEQWQPWYLPALLFLVQNSYSPYRALAATLMQAAGLDLERDGLEGVARQRAELAEQRRLLEAEQERLQQEVEGLRVALEQEVLRRWRRASNAYTRNFVRFLSEDLPRVQAFILAQPDYPRLKAGQEAQEDLDRRLLNLERATTRLDKIDRLLSLAGKQVALERFGPGALRERYRALRACEAAPF